MQQFFQQFTPGHFVALAITACVTYLAATVGRRIAKHLLKLISTLEAFPEAIAKTEIMWERSADVQMLQEFERRRKAEAR